MKPADYATKLGALLNEAAQTVPIELILGMTPKIIPATKLPSSN